MEEAAYSAKAAREGKDIGKPGKMFSKIAKKAGEKYGSEERGKKVAGAILAKIRAKHMKEDNLEEMVVQKSQMRPGETLGQTMNRLQGKTAVKGGKNDPSSPNFAGPKPAATATSSSSGGDKGYSSDGGRTVSLKPMSDTGSAQAAEPPKTAPTPPAAQPKGVKPPEEIATREKQAATAAAGAPTPPSRPVDLGGSKPAPAPAQQPGAPKDDASASVKKLMSMNESVQVGANRYRIV
jgi:hypothetical protein